MRCGFDEDVVSQITATSYRIRRSKVLKWALFLSAFAALQVPVSRTCYNRKIIQVKRHNQARIALARRRCDVLYAMLGDGTIYQAQLKAAA